LSIFVSGGRAGCRSFGCTAHNLVCTPTNRLHRREEVEPGPVSLRRKSDLDVKFGLKV